MEPKHIYFEKEHSTKDDKLGQLALGNLPRATLSHNMLRKELIRETKSTSYNSLENSQSNYDT